jgi:hypothetical protein
MHHAIKSLEVAVCSVVERRYRLAKLRGVEKLVVLDYLFLEVFVLTLLIPSVRAIQLC